MTTFDKAAYDGILDEIEKYLGYLKGNELVFEYMEAVREKVEATGRPPVTQKNYTTPCANPEFTYQPLYHLPTLDGGEVPRELEKKIHANADACWHNGKTWAAGIAGQARAITEQITSPDVAELETALTALKEKVMQPLELLIDSNADLPGPYRIPLPDGENSLDGDWANLKNFTNTWHGTAAEEFRTLHDKLNSYVGMYAYFAATAALELAAATDVIASAQQGLVMSVKDVRKTLVAQLKEWHDTDSPPEDEELSVFMLIVELLPITKVYKGARLIVEAVDDPKVVIGVLADIKRTIVGKSWKGIENEGKEPFEAANSEVVLKSLTTMLRQTYLHDFMEALSELSAAPDGSLNFVRSLQDTGMWAPPTVPRGSVLRDGDAYPPDACPPYGSTGSPR
ncbi:hypothetical protein [Stackebrandtia nassauensis]|uniref:Uncharacterized protein n=1 Tax=Stackebrandtia nassauensis (strain DSM 44728 / CIP 108903 / NRRL B-16338 / NBRC 102104 / LLR-40K-21) TaxID=446470 RepID=D3PZJ4_STANL|nr:hypothetical protein [Stackebrandtia nassauensis]ADD41668.1 hypothetical protein Snas_1972 [Stackebrandtia nassauensis DSM 44728]